MIVARAYMHYATRPNDEWTHTLEYNFGGVLESGEAEIIAFDMAEGLSNMLLETVIIDRVVLSTWEQDSAPYDPSKLRVVPIGIFGLVEFLVGEETDDDIVVYVRKSVSSGRAGKIQLRGCLLDSNMESDAGSWVLSSSLRSALEARLDLYWQAVNNNGQVCLIGAPLVSWTYPATPEGTKQIPIPNYADEPYVREVNGVVLVGVNERQDTQ